MMKSVSFNVIIFTVAVGVWLPLLDITIINLAINDISHALHIRVDDLQWVISSYTLASVFSILLSAYLIKRYGAKCVWMLGLCVFFIGSLVAPVYCHFGALIAGRVMQGLGAGFISPTLSSVLGVSLDKSLFRKGMSYAAIPAVLAPIVAPFIGRWLLQCWGWQSLFWVNLPVSVLAMVLAMLFIPSNDVLERKRFDFVGFLLIGAFMVVLMGAISYERVFEVSFPIAVFMMVLVVVLLFKHMSANTSELIINRDLFRYRVFNGFTAALFLSSFIFYGGMFYIPFGLGNELGLTLTEVSVLLALNGFGALFSRYFLDVLVSKFGEVRYFQVMVVLAVLGTVVWFWCPIDLVWLGVSMVLRGAGIGFITIQAMSGGIHVLPKVLIPDGSTVSRIIVMVSASLSVAMLSLVSARFGFYGAVLLLFFMTLALFVCSGFISKESDERVGDV